MTKRYEIRRSSYFGNLAIASAAAIFALIIILIPESPTVRKSHEWILVLFFLFTPYGVYMFIAMPQSIELAPDGTLTFRSYLGTQVVSPRELTEIATESMGYYVIFRFGKKKIKLLNRIDGLYGLLSSLKAQTPDLAIRGL